MSTDGDITAVPGVGAQRAALLRRSGIDSVAGLLEYLPRDYLDRSVITDIRDIVPGEVNNVRARVAEALGNTAANGKVVSRMRVRDATGALELVWFNQPYICRNFKPGREYVFTGAVSAGRGLLQMQAPEYEAVREGELLHSGRIVPVYRSVPGLSQKQLRGLISKALELECAGRLMTDYLSERLRARYGLADRAFAIRNIHFPGSDGDFFCARKRLVFDELLLMQLALLRLKGANRGKAGIAFENADESRLTGLMPFRLTNAQQRVVSELKRDFQSGLAMNRLIQGDVGSGKTAVAMIAAYIAIQNGCQAVLMAPTDVLATQHYASFRESFGALGIETVLLKGALGRREKNAALERVKSGAAAMIIGTHAVIQQNVEFHNVGLVVTDEQHRFGVAQRLRLAQKAGNPHVAVMSATPIPRTLALILYGDMDISVLDELPPGRQSVDTFYVTGAYRERLYNFLGKQAGEGRQVYIICPMIEENEKLNAAAVNQYAENVRAALPGCTVRTLHGRMKPDEKQAVMDEFAAGAIDILVATTVVEVGVNVPNATVMVVENAERFGLAQLHQLRGRVGRGTAKSYCVLVTDSEAELTLRRLKAMRETSDGFKISELDLSLRGSGDFFGTRQHGLPEFKLANLYRDMETLEEARTAALECITGEGFERGELEAVHREAVKFFTGESREASDFNINVMVI